MRRLLPIFIAVVVIACLELSIHLIGNGGLYNTDYFDFSPLQRDVLSKHVIYDKFIRVLGDVPSDAVQVGDSSGFYGVRPSDVLAGSQHVSYLNLSCCGDAGWNGYLYESELALRSHGNPKFLVLHVTPFWAPASAQFYGDNQHAVLIRDYLLKSNWWHQLRPPSAGYRLRVTNLVYHAKWLDDFPYDAHEYPTLGYPSIRAWRQQFLNERGWSPMPVDLKDPLIKDTKPATCPIENAFSETRYLGLVRDDSLYNYLQRFALLARNYNARFVLVTNPVPCVIQNDAISADIARQMERFTADFPDAIIPFPFLRQWPQNMFSDRWHLNPVGAAHHSRLIGESLRRSSEKSPSAASNSF